MPGGALAAGSAAPSRPEGSWVGASRSCVRPGGRARGAARPQGSALRGLPESCRLRAAARGRRWAGGGAGRGGPLLRLASADPPRLPGERRPALSRSERVGVLGTGGGRGCSLSLPRVEPPSLPALEPAAWAPAESTRGSRPVAQRRLGCRPAVTLGSRAGLPAFAGSCGKERCYLSVCLFSVWRMHRRRLASGAAGGGLSDLLH